MQSALSMQCDGTIAQAQLWLMTGTAQMSSLPDSTTPRVLDLSIEYVVVDWEGRSRRKQETGYDRALPRDDPKPSQGSGLLTLGITEHLEDDIVSSLGFTCWGIISHVKAVFLFELIVVIVLNH